MKQTIRPSFPGLAFVVSVAFLLASFCIPAPASAATPNSAASSAAQEPKLTAEQQAYKKVRDKCLKKYRDEKIPTSQHHTFMNACFEENGIKKAVLLPHSLPPPPPVIPK